MRILLITPRSEFPDVTPGWLRIPQMSLLILCALSGSQHDVTVIDEEVEPVPIKKPWDLVGITVMTATANRAYRLTHQFRRRGVKVILGGVHPSTLPEEAAKHADSVVVGEAEGIWPQILSDAAENRLSPVYRNIGADINKIPLVHYDSERKRFPPTFDPVVASRGCPQGCDFCCVHNVYGRKFRRLPVERVIEQIHLQGSRRVIFLDDNLASNRNWALELFAGLKPYKLKMLAQLPVEFILDTELFSTAASAGLKGIFVGIETIDDAALSHFKKAVPVEEYAKAIRRCRNVGVFFHAALIFGMDFHTSGIFDRTLKFIIQHSVPSVSAYVLTPYPGTALFDRLQQENRLLHFNWAYYDHLTPVFQPARMRFEDLVEGYLRFRKRLFSYGGILRRFPAQLGVEPIPFLGSNLAFRRTTRLLEEHYHRYFNWLNANAETPNGLPSPALNLS